MKALLGLLLGFSAVFIGALSGRLVRRYQVEGRSMLQAYRPGERLVIESLSYKFRRPRISEAVVVRQPGSNGRLDLKRIAAGPGAEVTVRGETDFVGSHEWFILGDNLDESTDSRELGPVKAEDIVGRVWFKY